MATHSSTPAWKIPWTEEPGRLQSMGSWRVRHDRETSLWLFTFMRRRRKWQPTPVFLPGESQGWGSLVSCRLRGRMGLPRVGHDWSNLAAVAAAGIREEPYNSTLPFPLPPWATAVMLVPLLCDSLLGSLMGTLPVTFLLFGKQSVVFG